MTASKVTINVAQQLGVHYLIRVTQDSPDGIDRFVAYSPSVSYKDQYYPFGNGIPSSGYNRDLVAMWQAFAQHLGHTIADRIYGSGEYSFALQGKTWISTGGISSSSKYLEGFDPTIIPPYELYKWIPVGLVNDLMDNVSDPFLMDNVSGFTYSDIQSAYYTEPLTMLDFKNALKAIKPSQATAIDQLFAAYGY